jgi:rhodanese-related sulfurtransferase
MKKLLMFFMAGTMACALASPVAAESPKDGEKAFLTELKKAIPQDHVKSVDDLYAKWQDVQAGKSKAVIIDIRTQDEFDAGHILGSNNIDSGHAYQMPGKFTDPDTEIWVFCRTQHRASYFTSMLYKYGYKNVYLAEGGIAGWASKGYPLANEYLGQIVVSKYEKKLSEEYVIREGH